MPKDYNAILEVSKSATIKLMGQDAWERAEALHTRADNARIVLKGIVSGVDVQLQDLEDASVTQLLVDLLHLLYEVEETEHVFSVWGTEELAEVQKDFDEGMYLDMARHVKAEHDLVKINV